MAELINDRSTWLIKRTVEKCIHGDCSGCAYFDRSNCEDEVCRDIFALIKRNEDAQPRWISVKDRLPEEGKSVLVHYVDGWMPVAHLFNGKWYQSGGETSWLSVTHWMPLPEPPKEE